MHLQEFAIFNLPNLSFSLIYLHQELFSVSYFFFHLPTWLLLVRNSDAKSEPCAYICALEACFFQIAKKCQVLCQTIGEVFFLLFLPKLKDANLIWQTVGDALLLRVPNSLPFICITCSMLLLIIISKYNFIK